MNRTLRVLLGTLMLGVSGRTSTGAIHTFVLEGRVDSITNLTGSPVSIETGDLAVFTYTFDNTSGQNSIPHSYNGISSTLVVGGHVLETPDPPILSVFAGSAHSFTVTSSVSGFTWYGRTQFSLQSNRNDIFVDDALPTAPPDVSLFSSRVFQIVLNSATGSPHLGISGDIESSYEVPEPCSMLMMIGGSWLVVIVTARRRM